MQTKKRQPMGTRAILTLAVATATCLIMMSCDKPELMVFTPEFSDIELHCDSVEPDFGNPDITFACSAAFTKDYVPFSHGNIIGSHVSHGVLYRRDSIWENRGLWGVFTFYDGRYFFDTQDLTGALEKAEANGGMGFMQYMVVENGKACKKWRKNIFRYRVLCEIDDTLRIVESNAPMPYSDFVDSLMARRPRYAIYLDMGRWDYCKYRDCDGKIIENGHDWHKFSTNCIVFTR